MLQAPLCFSRAQFQSARGRKSCCWFQVCMHFYTHKQIILCCTSPLYKYRKMKLKAEAIRISLLIPSAAYPLAGCCNLFSVHPRNAKTRTRSWTLSGTNCCFQTQDEAKGIHQKPARHFLSQRRVTKSPYTCPQAKYYSNKTSSVLHRWQVAECGVPTCWETLELLALAPRKRQGSGSNSLQPPQQGNQLTSTPSHQNFS